MKRILLIGMGIENVAIDEVRIIGKGEKRVVIRVCRKWEKESVSDMPPGGFMLAARRCCVATQVGCWTVVMREKDRK